MAIINAILIIFIYWETHLVYGIGLPESSYLVCYNQQASSSDTKDLRCLYACLTINNACFCEENFKWTFADPLLSTDKTCKEFACEKNIVITDAHTLSPWCYDEDASVVFDLVHFFSGNWTENFIKFSPLENLHIFEELSVELFAPKNGGSYYFDFGDGYSIEQMDIKAMHIYTKPGIYVLNVNVISQNYANYSINVAVRVWSLQIQASLTGCSHDVFYLSEDDSPLFSCKGNVLGGDEINVEWDFNEKEKIIFNLSSPIVYHSGIKHCFYNCSTEDLNVTLSENTDHFLFGTFMLFDDYFEYNSFLVGVELFARNNGNLRVQIYTESLKLVISVNLQLTVGYNLIQFAEYIDVKQQDIVGIWLDDMNLLSVVKMVDSFIEYFDVSSTDDLTSAKDTFANVAFRMRFIMSTFTNMFVDYDMAYAGSHDISFQMKDASFGSVVHSNKLKISAKSYRTVIHIEKEMFHAVLTEPFSICVDIGNGALSDVRWYTLNSSVFSLKNGFEEDFFISYHMEIEATDFVKDCHEIYFRQPGFYVIEIESYVDNIKTSNGKVNITVYPPITGLRILYSTVNRTMQFDTIHFWATVDDYPYDYRFDWNFINFAKINLTRSQLNQSVIYTLAGVYNVSLTAKYGVVQEVASVLLMVEKGFWIVGDERTLLETWYRYEVVRSQLIEHQWDYTNWTFQWNFFSNKINETLMEIGVNFIKYKFPNVVEGEFFEYGEQVEVQCKVVTGNADLLLKFMTYTVGPIYDLYMGVVPGYKALVNQEIEVEATSRLYQSLLKLTWTSPDFEILSTNHSTVKVLSNRTGLSVIYVIATNGKYYVNDNLRFVISVPLTNLSIKTSSRGVEIAKSLHFEIEAVGGFKKSFLFDFRDGSSAEETTNMTISHTFMNLGSYKVHMTLLMDGRKEACTYYSLILCDTTLSVDVLQLIEDLQLYYRLSEETVMTLINSKIHIASRSSIHLRFITFQGTQITFELTLNGNYVGIVHDVQVGAQTSAEIMLSFVNFWNPGVYECVVVAYNYISTVNRTFFIHVHDALEGLNISGFDFVEINKMYLFEAFLLKGTDMYYTWKFNGTYSHLSNSSVQNHIFTQPGLYNVSVHVYNAISELSGNILVNAIKPLKDLNVYCGSKYLKTNELHHVLVNFSSGQFLKLVINNEIIIANTYNEKLDGKYHVQHGEPGLYHITNRLTSPLGVDIKVVCNYTVQNVVESLTIDVNSKHSLYVKDKVNITLVFAGGTDVLGIIAIYTYNDFRVESYNVKFIVDENSIGGKAKIQHQFNKQDNYRVVGIAYNNVSSMNTSFEKILVIGRVENAQQLIEFVAEPAEVGHITKVHVVYKANFKYANCIMHFDADSNVEISESRVVEFMYSGLGDYNISVNCLTDYGILNDYTIAHVQQRLSIEDVSVPTLCVKFENSFVVWLSLQDINMLSYLENNVFINSELATPNVFVTERNISLIFQFSDYKVSGNIALLIQLTNHVSEVSIERSVCVMKVIKRISSQTPLTWRYGKPTLFKITVQSESAYTLELDFGDDSNSTLITSNAVSEVLHSFLTDGLFNYTIKASNNVSQVLYRETIHIVQLVANVSVVHAPQINWPVSTSDFSLKSGDNVAPNTKVQVQFHFGDGSVSEWRDVTFDKSDEVHILSYAYSKPGCYFVVTTIKGRINTVVLKSTLIINNVHELNVSLSSLSPFPTKNNTFRSDKPITINITNSPAANCFSYKWEVQNFNGVFFNGTSEDSSFEINVLVGQTGFFTLYISVSINLFVTNLSTVDIFLTPGLPPLFITVPSASFNEKQILVLTERNPAIFTSLNVTFGDGVSEIVHPNFKELTDRLMITDVSLRVSLGGLVYYTNLTHIYANIGLHTVSVSAENLVSKRSASQTLLISLMTCDNPAVHIVGSGDSNLLSFRYQSHITIKANVKVNCKRTKLVLFSWHVFKITVWEYENEINSDEMPELSLNVTMRQSSLNIAKRTLPRGYYFVRVITTLSGVGLDNSANTYIEIIEDPIIAKIVGGSTIELPWKQPVVLDANQSVDPNEDVAYLEYEWFCEIDANTDCFGNGLNSVEYFGARWVIEEKMLLEGVLYRFTVAVTNKLKHRRVEAKQNVTLLDAEIPVVQIKCQWNCLSFVSPSLRLALIGSCVNCDSRQSVIYQWQDVSVAPVVQFSNNTLTPSTASNLVVKPGTFVGGGKYKLQLKVTKSSGISSTSEYHINVNSLPSLGTCRISPFAGTSLVTEFTISCIRWISSVRSLNYRVLLRTQSEDKLLSHGPQQLRQVMLPSGEEANDYIIDLAVEIVDLYGSFTSVELQAKVMPILKNKNVDDIQHHLLLITSGNDSSLEELFGAGDNQGLMQLINSLTEALNQAIGYEESANETLTMVHKMQRKQIRNAMVETISKVEVNSVEDLKQTADTIAPLLQAAEELTEQTQELALVSFTHMTDYLEKDVGLNDGENLEKVSDITTGLVKATGNLLNSIPSTNESYHNETTHEMAATQKKKEELTKSTLNVVDKVLPLLLMGKIAGETATRITSSNIAIELSRQNSNEIGGTIGGGTFKIPEKIIDLGNETMVVDYQMSTLSKNPFSFDASAAGISAPISSLTFSAPNSTVLPVNNLNEEVEMFIPQKNLVAEIPINSTWLGRNKIIVYRVNITQTPGLSLLCKLNVPNNHTVKLLVKRGEHPTESSHDAVLVYNSTNHDYMNFPAWRNVSAYYVGVMFTNHSAVSEVLEVKLEMFTTGCLYWNDQGNVWDDEGCHVGPLTTHLRTHCMCDHLTWFGSNFFVPPNKLDISLELMKLTSVENYPALLASFCTLIGIYIIAMVYARRKDNLDAPLSEAIYLNIASPPNFTYHLAVYTGHRPGSGTTATPTLILSGDEFDSPPLLLKSNKRRLFSRTSVETFVFNTSQNLGDLRYCSIWHDDGGSDPSWFLSRLTVTNLETNKQYVCFCNKWLAVDMDEGLISMVLPVASKDELESFENIFLAKTARDLTDGHLWFSIISRPPRSNFSRMQRVSCCLCLLLSTMLSNAMFYRVEERQARGNEIELGGMQFSWSKTLIGIQSSLIVLPLNLLIVLMFRRARPNPPTRMKMKNGEKSELQSVSVENTTGIKITVADPVHPNDVILVTPSSGDLEKNADRQSLVPSAARVLSNISLSLLDGVVYWPKWVKYLAWFLLAATSFVAGFFTLLYGLSFGRVGQEDWLFSFFVSVFTDIAFNQPVKVIVIAAIITLVMRRLKDDYIMAEIDNFKNYDLLSDITKTTFVASDNRPVPPSTSYIERTRKHRLYEAKMVDIVIEIVAYLFYVFLCLLITYGHRDPDAYSMTRNIEDIFITNKFDQIRSIPDFWKWSHEVLSPSLFGSSWYNSGLLSGKNRIGYLSDDVTYLIGAGRMRQLRSTQEKCIAYGLFGVNRTTCAYSYARVHEDKTPQYCPGWEVCLPNQFNLYSDYWRYRDHGATGDYTIFGKLATYSGSGYVVDIKQSKHGMDSTLAYLYKHHWLDKLTRMLVVELTVYNTQANFYVIIIMLLEMPPTGGVVATHRILTTRLDRYSSGFSIFLGVCELAFLAFTIYYMYREFKRFLVVRWRYFADWRNWLELTSFSLIWTCVVLFVLRYGVVDTTKRRYYNDRSAFVSFDAAALSDQAYGHVLAFVVFLIFLKFLKLLRFNNKMNLMFNTMLYASGDLKYFTISFAVLFLAYSQLAYLLFKNDIEAYNTFISTMVSLFNLILGKFDFAAIGLSHFALGPLFFITYIFTMTYIFINMFIAIVIEAFSTMQKDLVGRKNKYELVDFLASRFASLLPAAFMRKTKHLKGALMGVEKKPTKKRKLTARARKRYIIRLFHEYSVKLTDGENLEGNRSAKRRLPTANENVAKTNPMDALSSVLDRVTDYIDCSLYDDECKLQRLLEREREMSVNSAAL